jgi:hypothetical protein
MSIFYGCRVGIADPRLHPYFNSKDNSFRLKLGLPIFVFCESLRVKEISEENHAGYYWDS